MISLYYYDREIGLISLIRYERKSVKGQDTFICHVSFERTLIIIIRSKSLLGKLYDILKIYSGLKKLIDDIVKLFLISMTFL